MKSWDLELIYNSPVTIEVNNGLTDTVSGTKFHVTPPHWSRGRVDLGQYAHVDIKTTFPRDGPRPSLEGLVINGKYKKCASTPSQPTPHPQVYHNTGSEHTHHGDHIHALEDHSHDEEHEHGHSEDHTHAPGDDHTHAPGVHPHDHTHAHINDLPKVYHNSGSAHSHHEDHTHAPDDHSHDNAARKLLAMTRSRSDIDWAKYIHGQ